MKDLNFVSIDIPVSFLKPFSKYQKNVYALFTMLVKNGFYGEYYNFKTIWKTYSKSAMK